MQRFHIAGWKSWQKDFDIFETWGRTREGQDWPFCMDVIEVEVRG